MRFAICNETYQHWSLEAICADVAEAGYEALEIAPFTLRQPVTELTEADARRAGQTAREAGLAVAGLHWLLAKTQGLSLTAADQATQQHTIDFGRRLVDACAAMGGRVMVWGSPKQRAVGADRTAQQARDAAAATLGPICEAAQAAGVTIALEPLPRGETDFLNTADEARQLIEHLASPACRLHLDVKAMCDEPTPIPQLIREHGDLLHHFHANDPNLRGPGQGAVDFRPIAAALHEINYTGDVSVEVFDYTPDGPTIGRQSLQYLDHVWQEVAP
jgi:sugar phosphate isomerase/epimerase